MTIARNELMLGLVCFVDIEKIDISSVSFAGSSLHSSIRSEISSQYVNVLISDSHRNLISRSAAPFNLATSLLGCSSHPPIPLSGLTPHTDPLTHRSVLCLIKFTRRPTPPMCVGALPIVIFNGFASADCCPPITCRLPCAHYCLCV